MGTAGESLNEAPKYVCSTKNKGCGTPDIDAEPFNRLILRTVLNAILDESNISKVTEIVQEKALVEKEYMRRIIEYLKPSDRVGPYRDAEENPWRVRQYSLNPDTYLRPINISTARAIMESAVTEILTGSGSATINYRLPLPHGAGKKARSSDEVQF